MKKILLLLTIIFISFISYSQDGDQCFIHTATAGNISSSVTYIDHPALNNNPSAEFYITHSLAGDGSVTYNNHKTGIYYSTSQNKWSVYYEDQSPMNESTSYNVYIPGNTATTVQAVSPGGNYYFIIDNPELNNKPDLHPVITHVYSGYQDHNYGVYYATAANKWGIYCEDGTTEIPSGAKFNVLVKPSDVGYNTDVSFRFVAPANANANGVIVDHPLLNNNPDAKFIVTHHYESGFFDHTLTTYYSVADAKWQLATEDSPVDLEGYSFNIVVSVPAPENDLCENATALTVGESFDEYAVEGTLLGSDGDGFGSVWYTVVAPTTGYLTIETDYSAGSPMHDTWMSVNSGSCGDFTVLATDDNSGNGNFSKVELSGLTPGETIYVRIEEDFNSTDPSGAFMISAYDSSLGIADAVVDGFSMYPNPVENMLNIETTNPVKAISIYNMLGQEVINTSNTQIDMSNLPKGSYIVKIQAGEQTGAYKLIKK